MSGTGWTMRHHRAGISLAGLAALVTLSACSAGPELVVEQAPQTAVVFNRMDVLAADSDDRAAAAVVALLQSQHGIAVGDDWSLVATLAVRPVEVGTFSDPDGREGNWTETPRIVGARRGPGLHVLTVVATRKDGGENRVARVSARGPMETTSDDLVQLLADAAARALVEGMPAQ